MNHSVSEKWPWQTPLPSLLVTHGTFPFIPHRSFRFVFTPRLPVAFSQLCLTPCLELFPRVAELLLLLGEIFAPASVHGVGGSVRAAGPMKALENCPGQMPAHDAAVVSAV